MKKISDYVKSNVNINEIKAEVLSNPAINKIVSENNITGENIDNNLTKLYRFTNEVIKCRGCKDLDECSMDTVGFYPKLNVENNNLNVEYVVCEYYRIAYREAKRRNKLKSMYMTTSNYADFEHTEERKAILEYIIDFLQSDKFMRGMFIHGKPGIGKTRILTVTAKKLSQNKEVLFVNYPDFVRKIKSSINDGSLENKVELLKNIPILILDDFGDEGIQSDWFRDEVLMPILQSRMALKKPVFFGSNYSLLNLEESFSQKVGDSIKVERLMERIRTLSKPFELKGKNYRE